MKTSATTRKKNKLEKEAEEIRKQLALKKWGTKCLACNGPGDVFHHFVLKSRSVLLRFHVDNAIPLCQKCHYNVHHSYDPIVRYDVIKAIRTAKGEKWCAWIDMMRPKKLEGTYGIHYLEDLIEELKKQL